MKNKRRYWTKGELVSMRELYPYVPTHQVARKLKRNERSVYSKAMEMGLKKHPSYFENYPGGRLKGVRCSKGTEFKPGNAPWNKGLKGYNPGGRSVETRFKKGNLPHTTLQDGAVTVRVDSRGVPVKHIRIDQGKWEYLSRHTWRQHYGEIPAGHYIVHKDGDTMNCNIENLECISRAENMRRNTIHRYPEDLKATIKLISKLEKTINNATQHNG